MKHWLPEYFDPHQYFSATLFFAEFMQKRHLDSQEI
jgi:hypothetical protein